MFANASCGLTSSSHAAAPGALLIMSASRSGSTVLCNTLGQTAGAFGAGELHRLWDSAALPSRMRSCGKAVLTWPLLRRYGYL